MNFTSMSNQQPKLILIPGLGTDKRLFEFQRRSFPDLIVPPWILSHNDETLADYAARMAETIPAHEPFVLGGVSLGGMLAYEIARHAKPLAVIQIASCCTRQGIRGFFRATGHLWPAVPTGAFKIAKFISLPVLRTFGVLSPAQRQLCSKMFSESDSRFMHWAVSAILNWNPAPPDQTPVYQIHGARDQIIPAKCVSPDEIIPDGGHLINLSHADVVNAYIRDVIAKVCNR
jgi:pimeloyl-ACP methyl ester carboxylesterase